MRFIHSAILLLTIGLAKAQLPNLPGCSLECFLNAMSHDGCSSITDFACHCQRPALVNEVSPCVQGACNLEDQSSVSNAVTSECSSVGHPITIPPVGGASTTQTSSSTESTSSSTASTGGTTSGPSATLPTTSTSTSTTAESYSSSIVGSSSPAPSSSSSSSTTQSASSTATSATTSTSSDTTQFTNAAQPTAGSNLLGGLVALAVAQLL